MKVVALRYEMTIGSANMMAKPHVLRLSEVQSLSDITRAVSVYLEMCLNRTKCVINVPPKNLEAPPKPVYVGDWCNQGEAIPGATLSISPIEYIAV